LNVVTAGEHDRARNRKIIAAHRRSCCRRLGLAIANEAAEDIAQKTKKESGVAFKRLSQQGIVFGIFAALFVAFAIFLPGFASTENMFTLLQNVAVLGILGLAMAPAVIKRST
jgi:hypothetical protein